MTANRSQTARVERLTSSIHLSPHYLCRNAHERMSPCRMKGYNRSVTPTETTRAIFDVFQQFMATFKRFDFMIVYPTPTATESKIAALLKRKRMQGDLSNYTVPYDGFLERLHLCAFVCLLLDFCPAKTSPNAHNAKFRANTHEIGRIDCFGWTNALSSATLRVHVQGRTLFANVWLQ